MVGFPAKDRGSSKLKDTNRQLPEIGIKIASYVFASMVFLGAILLFGLEPLVGRILIPQLGDCILMYGSPD